MNTQNLTGINFRFSDYINESYSFYKQNFNKVFVASLLLILLSMIPLCNYLAFGNFLKFMKRLRQGQNPEPTEIFNFDDFLPYLKLSLILFAAVFVMEIPVFFQIGFTGFLSENRMEQNFSALPFFLMIYVLVLMCVLFYLMARAFYIPYLISVKRITNLAEAWRISSLMAGKNIFYIIAYLFVVSFLGQLGVFACFIGIIFTMPFFYLAVYIAMEDGVAQADSGLNNNNLK